MNWSWIFLQTPEATISAAARISAEILNFQAGGEQRFGSNSFNSWWWRSQRFWNKKGGNKIHQNSRYSSFTSVTHVFHMFMVFVPDIFPVLFRGSKKRLRRSGLRPPYVPALSLHVAQAASYSPKTSEARSMSVVGFLFQVFLSVIWYDYYD